MNEKLYHLGLKEMSLNGISHALKNRPSSVFREFFYSMQSKFKRQRLKLDKNLKRFVSILDATSMPFGGIGSNWAKAGKQRCEAKAHCQIDANGKPLDMVVTGASVHDINGFKNLNLGKTELLLMDRAFYGFNFWQDLYLRQILFITRTKKKMSYVIISNRPGRKPKGVIEDQKMRCSALSYFTAKTSVKLWHYMNYLFYILYVLQ
ncbi:MAG: transposase [Candidatus Zixiibacteriota bacterium]